MIGALGAITSIVPEIFKLAQSGKDRKLGEQYLNAPRPMFKTPEEVYRAYLRKQMLAGQPLPGKGYMEEDLEEVTSSGVRGLQELARPTEAAAGAMGLYGQQLDQGRQLSMDEAVLRRQGQEDLASFETGVLAPYKEKEFDINQFQPYQQAQQAAAALLSSGEKNLFSGLTGISRIGTTLAGLMGDTQKAETGTGGTDINAFFGGDGFKFDVNEYAPSADEDLAAMKRDEMRALRNYRMGQPQILPPARIR